MGHANLIAYGSDEYGRAGEGLKEFAKLGWREELAALGMYCFESKNALFLVERALSAKNLKEAIIQYIEVFGVFFPIKVLLTDFPEIYEIVKKFSSNYQ